MLRGILLMHSPLESTVFTDRVPVIWLNSFEVFHCHHRFNSRASKFWRLYVAVTFKNSEAYSHNNTWGKTCLCRKFNSKLCTNNCIDCLNLLWYYAISNGEELHNNVAEGHAVLKLRVKQLTLKLKALKSSEKALHNYHLTRRNILKDM